jgi:CRISPR-associated endoribonuclease Cas6/Csy4 subtype I-F
VYGNLPINEISIAGADSSDSSLEAVWSNLPRYKRWDDGTYERITYKVFESASGEPSRNSVPGYADQVITGDDENGFTITNKRVPELRGVTVTKQWNDFDDLYHSRPEGVTFRLDQWKAGDSTPIASNCVVARADDGWKATWLDLPARYGDSSKEFEYALREDAVSDYTAGDFLEGDATMQVQIPAGVTPLTDSVTVTLMEDGTAKGSSIVLNAANNWTGTFENIDPSNVSTSGYYDVIVQGTDSGIEKGDLQKTFIRNYTITNTYTQQDEVGTITVKKRITPDVAASAANGKKFGITFPAYTFDKRGSLGNIIEVLCEDDKALAALRLEEVMAPIKDYVKVKREIAETDDYMLFKRVRGESQFETTKRRMEKRGHTELGRPLAMHIRKRNQQVFCHAYIKVKSASTGKAYNIFVAPADVKHGNFSAYGLVLRGEEHA